MKKKLNKNKARRLNKLQCEIEEKTKRLANIKKRIKLLSMFLEDH